MTPVMVAWSFALLLPVHFLLIDRRSDKASGFSAICLLDPESIRKDFVLPPASDDLTMALLSSSQTVTLKVNILCPSLS